MSIFSELPTHQGHLPGFDGATGWLNSEPLGDADLTGKVVLVDFWTYTCINWLRTLPYIRAWAEKYEDAGLVVVGVHTPEFPFERDVENVRMAVREMAVEYPVALDPQYAVWQAFANQYWPAVYIADAEGRIRHHQFGEGGYEECERVIQELLRESGRDAVPDDLVAVVPAGIEVQADWSNVRSPETYLNQPPTGGGPVGLRLNEWSLSGDWKVEERASVLDEADGTLAFRFHARDAQLVMSTRPAGASVPFRVSIDGQPPGDSQGLDIDRQGNGAVTQQRLYQLIRQPGAIANRTLELTFLAPGVEAYVFTFG